MRVHPSTLFIIAGIAFSFLSNPICGHAATVTVSGADSVAKTVTAGNELSVTASGNLSVSGSTVGVTINGNNGTVTNAGTIAQIGSGRAIDITNSATDLTITNQAGATISSTSQDTVRAGANSTVTVTNNGTIVANGGGQALDLVDSTTYSVTNGVNGVIRSGSATSTSDAVRLGKNGSVDNYGLIESLFLGDDGKHAISYKDATNLSGVTITVRSTGKVYGGKHGITGDAAGLITVEAGGQLIGRHGSGVNIDTDNEDANGIPVADGNYFTVTVNNSGLISGDYSTVAGGVGDGDGVDADELLNLTNFSTGVIRGTGAAGGDNNTEGVAAGGGTIDNRGQIYGETVTGDQAIYGRGIVMDNGSAGAALAATTITNRGTGVIEGRDGAAVILRGDLNDTITNEAGGLIQGTRDEAVVSMGGGTDAFNHAGTLRHATGGVALDMGDGNDQVVMTGAAVVQGHMDGGAGTDALVISTSSAFAYQGEIRNFETGSKLSSGSTLAVGASNAASSSVAFAQSVFALEAGSTLAFDLFAGGVSDQILLMNASQFSLGGATLQLALGAGFSADVGEVYTLISGSGRSGTFAGLSDGAMIANGGYQFAINYQGSSGVELTVAAVPEPGRMVLVAMGLAWLGLRRRRK